MRKLCMCILLLAAACSFVFAEDTASKVYSLGDCIAAAAESNSDLIIAGNNLEISKTSVTRALSGYFPQISVSNDTFEIAEDKYKTMDKGTTLSAQWKLFDMGLRELNVSGAKSAREQQIYNYARTYQTVYYNVVSSYYNVLRYKELLDVSKGSVAYYEQLEKETQAQIDQGTAAPVDILSIQAQLADSRVSLLNSQKNVTNALNQLQNNMGLFISDGFDIEPISPEDSRNVAPLADYIKLAADERKDLVALDYGIKSAKTEKKIAQREYLPQLDVTGSYNHYWEKDRLYNNDARIMGTISLNIFDGLSREANVKAKNLSLDNAKENKLDLEKTISQNINSLYTDIMIDKEQMGAAEKGLSSAQKNREVQTEKYAEGLATNLDILNAQAQLESALAGSINAKYNYKLDLIELDYQTGITGTAEDGIQTEIIGEAGNEEE